MPREGSRALPPQPRARGSVVVACYRQTNCKMWPYLRNTESVAELKMKFAGNQNVKNGIGVTMGRTPLTSTDGVVNGLGTTNGTTHKTGCVDSKKMIKDSAEDLSLGSKNSSRVKDLIKKLNEGSQQSCLQKKNGLVCKNDASAETGSPKPTDRITVNVEAHHRQVSTNDSTKTTVQDVLDVRKKSVEIDDRVGESAADSVVPDKENSKLPQMTDLATMYSLLSEKHTELLRAYNCMQVQQLKDTALRKDKREIQRLLKINAELSTEVNKLQTQLKETAEHNELLEFRLLELDDMETTTKLKNQNRENTEDMSDSGVMSLTTSDDFCSDGDQLDNELDVMRCDNIKQRLMEMYNSVCYCVEDRSTINQVLALIRHFECRLTDGNLQSERHHKPAYADCLQESGIFEEDCVYTEAVSEATQTEAPFDRRAMDALSTDLTEELRKLSRIREKIEERKVPLVDERAAKELSFYKQHWRALARKVEAYECANDDERTRLLTAAVDRESRLAGEVNNLYATVDRLKERNRLLEEEKCEFEEAENDTRLNFQKLENKHKTLTEKKNALQTELAARAKEIETLRREAAELDAKKCEARKHAATMEALVNKYEQRNFELEESAMESKCKLQLLENAWPAVVLWNIWRVVCKRYGRGIKPARAAKTAAVAFRAHTPDDRCEPEGGSREHADYAERLRIAAEERADAEKRVRELEFKENVYQQTLQQADNILASVEEGYRRKIDELNAELAEKRKRLVDRETRMRLSADSRDREPELLDRIHGLEAEARDLEHRLKAKDVEKQSWARREAQLRGDIEQFVDEVCRAKAENAALRNQVDCERAKMRDLRSDAEFKRSVYAELEEKSKVEAKHYQSTILKLTKQIDDYDVTNGELKEEVETLEAHVKLLRNALAEEKELKENLTVELNQELSRKQEIIDNMERHMSYNGSKNAAEELQSEILKTNNVGKLNLEQTDDHDEHLTTTFQLSNLKQLKTCDACFKNFEPLLQKIMDNFNNALSSIDQNTVKANSEVSIQTPNDCLEPEKPVTRSECRLTVKQTVCRLTEQAAMLEAKNAEKNKIIMTLADELLRLCERSSARPEFARCLDAVSACAGYAPDFNCTTVKRYLNVECCGPDEKSDDRKYECLIGPENPIGLHVVRQIGPDGIILAWKSPRPNTVGSFELFLNGKLAQKTRCPGRTTTVLCPVNLREPLTIRMNAVKDDGDALPPIVVHHPFVV